MLPANFSGLISPEYKTIVVPNVPPDEFIAQLKKKLNLSLFDTGFGFWDDYQNLYTEISNAGGKTFEVLNGILLNSTPSSVVEKHFAEKGFTGNTGAFISWLLENNPNEWNIPIHSHQYLWMCLQSQVHVVVALEDNNTGGNRPGFRKILGDNGFAACVFVAFREVAKKP